MIIKSVKIENCGLFVNPTNLLDGIQRQRGNQIYFENVDFENTLEEPFFFETPMFQKVQSILIGQNTQQQLNFKNVNLTRGIYTLTFIFSQRVNKIPVELLVKFGDEVLQQKTITQDKIQRQYTISFLIKENAEKELKLLINNLESFTIAVDIQKPILYKSVHTFASVLDIQNVLEKNQNNQSLDWRMWNLDNYQFLYNIMNVDDTTKILTLRAKWGYNYQELQISNIPLLSFFDYYFSLDVQTADNAEYDVDVYWMISGNGVDYVSEKSRVRINKEFKRILFPPLKYNQLSTNDGVLQFQIRPVSNNQLFIKLRYPFLLKSIKNFYYGILTHDCVKNELYQKEFVQLSDNMKRGNFSKELYKWKAHNATMKIQEQRYNFLRHPVYVQTVSNQNQPVQLELSDVLYFQKNSTYVFRISLQTQYSQQDVYDTYYFSSLDIQPLLKAKLRQKIIQNNNIVQEDTINYVYIAQRFKNFVFKLNINENIDESVPQTLRLEIENLPQSQRFYIKTPLLFKNNDVYTGKIQQLVNNLKEQPQLPLFVDIKNLPESLYIGTAQTLFYFNNIYHKEYYLTFLQGNLKLKIKKGQLFVIINGHEHQTDYEFFEENVYFILQTWRQGVLKLYINGLKVGEFEFEKQDFSQKILLFAGEEDTLTHFMKNGLNQPVIFYQISDQYLENHEVQYHEQIIFGQTTLQNTQVTQLEISKFEL